MAERMILARITIRRVLEDDDVIDEVIAEASDGTTLSLAESLGMMRLAEHTLIASYDAADEDDL